MRKCFVVLCLAMLGACSYVNRPPRIYEGMMQQAPEGTPTFRAGWKAGCETGLKVSGNTHYKFVHKFSFDPDYITDNDYNEAWYLGFDYCRWYVASWQRKM